MDRNSTEQTQPREPEGARPEGAAEPARKPYARPRLTEHGRVPALTFAAPSTQLKSDRNAKEHFEAIDSQAVLAAVARLPVERWSYKGETVRHLGPMAQDFAAAFGLGADDRHIFTLDAAGVALAAVQGLHAFAQAQQARLEALERELTTLRGETASLRLELAMHEDAPVG
jgi:endosialidase-like protein